MRASRVCAFCAQVRECYCSLQMQYKFVSVGARRNAIACQAYVHVRDKVSVVDPPLLRAHIFAKCSHSGEHRVCVQPIFIRTPTDTHTHGRAAAGLIAWQSASVRRKAHSRDMESILYSIPHAVGGCLDDDDDIHLAQTVTESVCRCSNQQQQPPPSPRSDAILLPAKVYTQHYSFGENRYARSSRFSRRNARQQKTISPACYTVHIYIHTYTHTHVTLPHHLYASLWCSG